ncbi:TPA: hypothetical protein HA259_00360 [Thermoplasmata archaeon]|nr:hypothetical protein [Thermoplasmata archaeon]
MCAKRAKVRRPFGVTVLAVLQTISGIQLLIQSLLFFVFATITSSPEVQESLSTFADENLVRNLPTIFALLGVVFLIIALLSFHLARGYMRGYEWARIRGRKVALLTLLFALISLSLMPARADPGAPVWTILFNLFILAYLGRRRVRAYFR